MKKTKEFNADLTNSKGIILALQDTINEVVPEKESIAVAQSRITGCKHAVQMYALSLEMMKMNNVTGKKIKIMELE